MILSVLLQDRIGLEMLQFLFSQSLKTACQMWFLSPEEGYKWVNYIRFLCLQDAINGTDGHHVLLVQTFSCH